MYIYINPKTIQIPPKPYLKNVNDKLLINRRKLKIAILLDEVCYKHIELINLIESDIFNMNIKNDINLYDMNYNIEYIYDESDNRLKIKKENNFIALIVYTNTVDNLLLDLNNYNLF
jgi:hypothetical protein